MSTWRVYVYAGEIHVGEQVNFSPGAVILGEEQEPLAPGDRLELEHPNGTRGGGHVVQIDDNGMIIEVGPDQWLLRHATENDVPFPGEGEPWFIVGHIP